MDEKSILAALKKAKELSKKRNFKQTVDLIITMKGLDMKKPDHQIDLFVQMPHPRGKETKVCALVGPETKDQAAVCDKVILEQDFEKYQADKKSVKKLSKEYEFFIAQANLMPKVATVFGRILGPKNKMPNPKAGAVFPPKANLKPLVDKLKTTVRITARTSPMVQCVVGKEDSDEKQVVDNVLSLYKQIVAKLPGEVNNVRAVMIKLTMGKPVKI